MKTLDNFIQEKLHINKYDKTKKENSITIGDITQNNYEYLLIGLYKCYRHSESKEEDKIVEKLYEEVLESIKSAGIEVHSDYDKEVKYVRL